MKMLTLDSAGYISDPPMIVDRVFNYFSVANYSQSMVHYGQIKSLPWLIQHHAQDLYGLEHAIKDALEVMLSGYFDSVNVDCQIRPEIEGVEVKQNIIVDVVVSRGFESWSVGKLLRMVNKKTFVIEDRTF